MKVKNNFFDKNIIKQFLNMLGVIELILALVLIFVDVPDGYEMLYAIIFVAVLLVIYVFLWISSNVMNDIKICINNSDVEIKCGDIFEENGQKVIAFNEYFDTIVDNKLISEQSLNGILIKERISDIKALDEVIFKSLKSRKIKGEFNQNKQSGKKEKYDLGTTIRYDKEFLFTAFSKFDEDNRAQLTIEEYIECLFKMWNELDILYNQNVVVIPLLGTGITRFKNYDITEQEKLEIILWTLKVSRVKFNYPAKICIVIHKDKKDKINLYKIKEAYKNGI